MKELKTEISEIIRFILVGVVNTLVGAGTMFLLYNLGHCSYWLSSIMNYIVGSICSFFLNKYFTFKKNEFKLNETVRFIINILLCYIVAYGLARPFARMVLSNQSITVQDNIAMLGGMVVFTALNYFGQKFFVFKN